MTKENMWSTRASNEDLELLGKLAKETRLSASMSMWHAVRFALLNIGMFKVWIKNKNGD